MPGRSVCQRQNSCLLRSSEQYTYSSTYNDNSMGGTSYADDCGVDYGHEGGWEYNARVCHRSDCLFAIDFENLSSFEQKL